MDVAHNLALAYARTGQSAKAGELIADVLVPGGDAGRVESAREALLDEKKRQEERQAEERITEGTWRARPPSWSPWPAPGIHGRPRGPAPCSTG